MDKFFTNTFIIFSFLTTPKVAKSSKRFSYTAHILTIFLLLGGIFWSGNTFSQTTATYTITSIIAATQTDTKPIGAGHSYSQTYTTTAKQITNTNSATLRLTGYAGYTITDIALEMKSNASAGEGTLSVVAGSTTIASVSPTAKFNTNSWYSEWSASYVTIHKSPSLYNIKTGEDVVITITATTNSLYIQSYTITYVPNYTVTYNANGGTGAPTDASSPYPSGTTVTVKAPGSMLKSGFIFAGWDNNNDGTADFIGDGSESFSISANTTLKAVWTAASGHTVTFNSNSGSGSMLPQNSSVPANLNLNTFTKTGYTFTGWNTIAGGGGTSYADGATYSFASDETLNAQWSINTYSLSYDGNGNDGGVVNSGSTYNYNNSVTLPSPTMTKIGHTFGGWNTLANGSGTNYLAGASYTIPAANTTLYAKWAPNNYTITFNGNSQTSGTPNIASVSGNYNTNVTLATVGSLVKTGYTFIGWNTKNDGTGTDYAAGSIYNNIASSFTLYAKWAINNYTVTFDGNSQTSGSPNIASVSGNYNTNVTLATIGSLVKTENTFGGWNTLANGSGTNYLAGASYTIPAANTTLYAKWTPNNYDVIFDKNNAAATGTMGNKTYAYGSTANLTANAFTLTGYAFKEWNTAADGSGTAYADIATYTMNTTNNVLLYAQWIVYIGPCHTEDFSNIGNTNGYGTRSWNGTGGTWTATDAREDQVITGKAITFRNGVVTSPNFTDGIGSLTVSTKYPFADGTGTIDLYINNVNKGSFNVSTSVQTQTINNINVVGNIIIEFRNTNTTKRPTIDDLSWTCYTATPEPEINIKGNGVSIVNGANTPSLTDHTDFGSTNIIGGMVTRTFTIENLGTATLNLTALSPYVVLTGSSDFTIATPLPSNNISTSSTTTFSITFDPSSIGTKTATINIANDDTDENPYTFVIQGIGTNSTASTLEDNTDYATTAPQANVNVLYANFTDNTNTTTGKYIPMKLRIRDSATDSDGLPTTLTGFKVSVKDISNIDRTNWIKKAIVTTSGGTFISAATISGGLLTFTGMSGSNVQAPSQGTKIIHLYVSFDETQNIIDNTKLIFTITEATADPSGSSFAASDGGGAKTDDSNGNNRNRINIIATKLLFSTVPNGTVSTDLGAFTITAVDQNNKTDIDVIGSLSLTTDGSGMSSGSYSLNSGTVAINSGIQFNTVQSNIHLTANIVSPSINGTSNTFNINDIPLGSYRTTKDGSWANTTGTSEWQMMTGSGWVTSSIPTINGSPTFKVYIYHNINLTAPSTNKNIIIENGGILNTGTQSHTFKNILVKEGGTLNKEAGNGTKFDSDGTLEVEDGGTMKFNRTNSSAYATNLWAGTEKFHEKSNFIVLVTDNASGSGTLITEDISSISDFNGAKFGNFIIDMEGNGKFPLFPTGMSNVKLTNGNFIFRHGVDNGPIVTNGDYTITIGDSLIIENTYNQAISLTNGNSTVSVTINKSFVHNGTAEFRLTHSQTTNNPSVTLNIDSNLVISNTGNFNFDIGSSSTGTNKTIVNLKGDLSVGSAAIIRTTNSNDAKRGLLNFTGIYNNADESSIQTIDIASTIANRNQYLDFVIDTSSYTQLLNHHLDLGTKSTVTVLGTGGSKGGTLDFNFDNSNNALNITSYSTGTKFNLGNSKAGGTLKITSPQGISTTSGSIGNVQVTNAPTYHNTSYFWYIGRGAIQYTGTGLPTGSSAKIVICDLLDNTKQLILSGNDGAGNGVYGISNTTTLSNTGGKLDIRRGQLIETENAYFGNSSGTLYMEAGTLYKIMKGETTSDVAYDNPIPRMEGKLGTPGFPYSLIGGTIELGGNTANNYFQVLRGNNETDANQNDLYYNVTYSGNNTLNTDFKALSNETTIRNSLYVTNNAIVDCRSKSAQASSFVGDGGLVMDGGRFRIKKVSSVQPELNGNSVAYNLTGGVVEFYGTSSTQQQQLRGNYKTNLPKIKINYFNLEINANAANLQTFSTLPNSTQLGLVGNVDVNSSFLLTGTLNINSPAVLRMDQTDFVDDGTGSSQVFNVNAGAGLLYANENGIKLSGIALTDGNIRTSGIRNFSPAANYGFVSSGNMFSGNGLPSTVAGLYIYKTNGTDKVTLNNGGTTVNGILGLQRGKIISVIGNKLTMEPADISTIKSPENIGNFQDMGYDSSYVVGPMGRKSAATSTLIFPIGSDTIYGPIAVTPNLTTPQVYTANYISTGHSVRTLDPTNLPQLDHISYVEYWNVASTVTGANDDAKIKLFWRTHSKVGPTNTEWSDLRIAHFDGIDWNTEGNSPIINGLSTSWGSVETSIYCQDFSPFTLGTTIIGNPLPIELISFTAKCLNNEKIQLDWITASETNSHSFEIEKSLDAVDFQTIGTIQAAGHSTQELHYQFIDKLSENKTYYRLKQIDLDGKINIYPIVYTKCGFVINGMNIYYAGNNQIKAEIQTNKSEDYTFNLFQTDGKLIYSVNKFVIAGKSVISLIPQQHLAKGIYLLQSINGENIQSKKLLID